jgi:hypothetical protein
MNPALLMLYGLGIGALSVGLWWANAHAVTPSLEDIAVPIMGIATALLCFIAAVVAAKLRSSHPGDFED